MSFNKFIGKKYERNNQGQFCKQHTTNSLQIEKTLAKNNNFQQYRILKD